MYIWPIKVESYQNVHKRDWQQQGLMSEYNQGLNSA